MRRTEIERKRALRDAIVKGKKTEKKAKKKINADLNQDGTVDEKDLSLVHQAYSEAKKKAKKIVKKN